MIADALSYPVRKENAPLMAVGAVFFCLPTFIGVVIDLGIVAILAQLVCLLYFAIFFHEIMESSSKGESRAPMWPNFTTFTDLATDAFQVIIPGVVSFLPLIALRVYYRNFGAFGEMLWRNMAKFPGIGAMGTFGRDVPALPPWAVALSYVLAGLGLVYLPMGMLACSFYGEMALLNVVAVVRSIMRIAKDYFAVVALLIGLLSLLSAAALGLDRLPTAPGMLLTSVLLFYAMSAGMRAIGLLYARNRERLGWEER